MKIYKTGDICPCCGQPIKLTDSDELFEFSVLVGVLGMTMHRIGEVIVDGNPDVEKILE